MDFTKSTFRVYEIVQPSETLVHNEKYDQIKLQLPGFKKEDIKVKLNNGTTLEISGEKLLGNKKWSSFRKDYSTPENCLTEEIRASLDDGFLRITMPKKIVTGNATSDEIKIVDDDLREEEKKNIFTTADEMVADNTSEVEKKASSTNSTITTNMTDDADSVTDETEKDAEHLQNEGKDYVDGVKEMKQDDIEDAMSQNIFAEDAIDSKILETDDMTEYAISQYELVRNMCAAGFVILMLALCNMD